MLVIPESMAQQSTADKFVPNKSRGIEIINAKTRITNPNQ